MKRFLSISLLILVLIAATVPAQKRPPAPVRAEVTVFGSTGAAMGALTPDQKRRQETFEKVWDTIRMYYFDATFHGLNWNQVKAEFQPQVTRATSDRELHLLLQQMISRLGASHLEIIPPEYLKTISETRRTARLEEKRLAGVTGAEKSTAAADDDDDADDAVKIDTKEARYGVGLEMRVLNNQFVVTFVDERSGAAVAGIKPGYVVSKINGVSLTDLVARIRLATANIMNTREVESLLPIELSSWLLNGPKDSSVFITCLDEKDQARDFKVPRLALPGEALSIGKNLPEQFVTFRSASLSDDIGYVKFNGFAIPLVAKFCDALSGLVSKKALVIDLRGNLGGIIATTNGIAGMLTDKPITLGTSRYRSGTEKLKATPKAKNFNGRIIVLVDGQSMSAAEMFAAALKDNKRAIIVGEKTGGEALPAIPLALPTGAVLFYPIANFTAPSGEIIEGKGVTPDYSISLDRASLLASKDVQLDKAIAIARDDTAFAKLTAPIAEAAPPPPAVHVATAPPPKAAGMPLKEMRLTRIGSVSGPSAPLPSAAKDPKAVALLSEFTAKMPAAEKLKNMSYAAYGRAVVDPRQSSTDVEVRMAREAPSRFSLTLSSPSIGVVHTASDGKKMFTETDYGMYEEQEMKAGADADDIMTPFVKLLDPAFLRSLKLEGAYELDGRKVNVFSGSTQDGKLVGFTLDPTTKMLLTFTLPGVYYSFGDYRPVDGIQLPFDVGFGYQQMNVHLTSYQLNPKIDPAEFQKTEHCYDKAVPTPAQ